MSQPFSCDSFFVLIRIMVGSRVDLQTLRILVVHPFAGQTHRGFYLKGHTHTSRLSGTVHFFTAASALDLTGIVSFSRRFFVACFASELLERLAEVAGIPSWLVLPCKKGDESKLWLRPLETLVENGLCLLLRLQELKRCSTVEFGTVLSHQRFFKISQKFRSRVLAQLCCSVLSLSPLSLLLLRSRDY